ncbi:MAG TPA: acyltransferase [Acidimicrobiia bacterium]|nr:acyltransferase [Acidimicrobiia bacterium]
MTLAQFQTRLLSVLARARARCWALVHPNVEAGEGAWVGRGCRLILDPGARLVLGPRCGLDDGTTVAVYDRGVLRLGAGSFVGHHSTLAARERVEIGEGTFLAELVSVRDHDHEVGRPPASGAVVISPVVIGREAWLGCKVTVVRGAVIGDGTVVAANAVVRGTLPPGVVAGGIPARVLRQVEQDVGGDQE